LDIEKDEKIIVSQKKTNMKISLRISIVYSALRSPMQTIIRSVPALCRVGRLHLGA